MRKMFETQLVKKVASGDMSSELELVERGRWFSYQPIRQELTFRDNNGDFWRYMLTFANNMHSWAWEGETVSLYRVEKVQRSTYYWRDV